MSKVLLGQSYHLRFDPKLWEAMQPYPPLGTLYAASYLRQRGYQVALYDAMLARSEEEWGSALEHEQPRFAVLYEDNFNYLSKMCLLRMREAAFEMIKMARQRGCIVIVGGSDATDHADKYLAQGADYVLLGEGEITLGQLLDHLTGQADLLLEDIVGLAFTRHDEDGTQVVYRTGRRPDIKALDELPFPAWDLVDVERYRHIWRERHGCYSMNMVTTRGCPYHCNWCAKPIWGQRYNVRSPENVAAELQWLKEQYAPDHIWFADDIMGLKPGWWARFAELIEMEGGRIPFKCLSRVDLLLRDGEVDALRRAGCEIVWVGAESGSQRILDAMEKGTTVEQIYAVAQRLHQAGVRVGFFLQFGYPGEQWEDIEKTLQMVRDCRPDDIGMSVSYPLPGTKFYERVREELGVTQNWRDSSDLAMLYRGPFTTDFYRQLHVVLHREFRMQRYWSRIRKRLHVPSSFGLGTLRDTAALLYHAVRLPVSRYRLGALAKRPHEGVAGLAGAMDPSAAALPTPQSEG